MISEMKMRKNRIPFVFFSTSEDDSLTCFFKSSLSCVSYAITGLEKSHLLNLRREGKNLIGLFLYQMVVVVNRLLRTRFRIA